MLMDWESGWIVEENYLIISKEPQIQPVAVKMTMALFTEKTVANYV